MPTAEGLRGPAAGTLSLRGPEVLLLQLHLPLLSAGHAAANLRRDAVLRPPDAAAPSPGSPAAPGGNHCREADKSCWQGQAVGGDNKQQVQGRRGKINQGEYNQNVDDEPLQVT